MCEGSYPYVTGGVSSWAQMLMTSLPDIEFEVFTVVVDRDHGGLFKYKMPPNLTAITETYLQDSDFIRYGKKLRLNPKQKEAFRSFVMGTDVDWATLFEFFNRTDVSVNSLLLGRDLLDIIHEFYDENYSRLPFTDFLWTYRSMMLPICTLLKNKIPKADVYHSASTGYCGVIACMAKYIYNKPAMITEHGIYTREREEDIIRSGFFEGPYKDMWIQHFYKLSECAYQYSDKVISLFEQARSLQIELGCNPAKTLVVPNGVQPDRFDPYPPEYHEGINLGIIARISAIKDIKTLINSFAAAKEEVPNLNLYIMGGYEEDDVNYYEECLELTKTLGIDSVYFTGNVNINEYMPRMDMIILTSISEGQPISVLEAMSAGLPCIATRVGNCDEMLLGSTSAEGQCGIITPIMSVEYISKAIIELALDAKKRKRFGEVARKRVEEKYPLNLVIERYNNLYKGLYKGSTSGREA